MRINYLALFFSVICHLSPVNAQIPIYAWRDHFSWNTAEIVAIADRKVYCSNGAGIFSYDLTSRNLEKMTKVNGLNDAGVTAMKFVESINAVVIGYANGNVDVVAGSRVHNVHDIKLSSRYSNKRINDIFVSGDNAYLSCAFGIVVVDVRLRQIRDTYVIGIGSNGLPVEVYSLTEYNGFFYAVTSDGLKKADSQSRQLTDLLLWTNVYDAPFEALQAVSTDRGLYVYDKNNQIFFYDGISWQPLLAANTFGTLRRLIISKNRLLVCASNGVSVFNTNANFLENTLPFPAAHDAAIDDAGAYWVACNRRGLIRWRSSNDISPPYALNGPESNHAAALRFKANRLLVASGAGGTDENGITTNRQGEIHVFFDNQWTTISSEGNYNFTDVDISENQPDRYYITSWGQGLYEYVNGIFYRQNSDLTADFSGNVFCGGVLIDGDNKLWVSNDKNISVFADGRWQRMSFETSASFGRLTADNFGQIWTTHGNNGLFVFNKTTEQGVSFKPNNYTGGGQIDIINQVTNAPDGVVWAATTSGPIIYNNPSGVLNGLNTGGSQPTRPGTSEPDRRYYLLGSENILSVAIDGANRKWFGTATAGVFLIDDDNRGEVKHFTTENSPLPSNRVHDIAINDKTGEVFFATEYGIVSYRSDAVSSGDDFGNVYAFPNPVRPGYYGEITITGLISDADVKITDIAGNLVYQTRTLGGQAVWNGTNQQGRRVASGVYLVFTTNDDGSKTNVTKILIVR